MVDHWKLIEKFNSELDKLEYFAYNFYNEIGFDIGMKKIDNTNEYKRYRLEREKLEYNFIAKFSKENNIDLGTILSYIPCILIW